MRQLLVALTALTALLVSGLSLAFGSMVLCDGSGCTSVDSMQLPFIPDVATNFAPREPSSISYFQVLALPGLGGGSNLQEAVIAATGGRAANISKYSWYGHRGNIILTGDTGRPFCAAKEWNCFSVDHSRRNTARGTYRYSNTNDSYGRNGNDFFLLALAAMNLNGPASRNVRIISTPRSGEGASASASDGACTGGECNSNKIPRSITLISLGVLLFVGSGLGKKKEFSANP